MNILVLYYSGVGNTKMVAEKIYDLLKVSNEVTIASIEKLTSDININQYDSLVIGFPTIHAAPAKPILTFLNGLDKLTQPIKTFIYTTCGMYSANTLRIFAKKCIKKNIMPILSKSYRCAATDGILIVPSMKIWVHHEKNLDKKIEKDVVSFYNKASLETRARIPRFKLYSILNYPNKLCGRHFPNMLYLHKQDCISCKKCLINCPVNCIIFDDEGYPILNNEKCIHCYRCIHHCPKKAISLSKKHPTIKTIEYK